MHYVCIPDFHKCVLYILWVQSSCREIALNSLYERSICLHSSCCLANIKLCYCLYRVRYQPTSFLYRNFLLNLYCLKEAWGEIERKTNFMYLLVNVSKQRSMLMMLYKRHRKRHFEENIPKTCEIIKMRKYIHTSRYTMHFIIK